MSTDRRPTVTAAVVSLAAIAAGVALSSCGLAPLGGRTPIMPSSGVPSRGSALMSGQITTAQLGAMTSAYADRYMTLIATASDAILAGNPSAEQRRLTHQLRVASVSGVYDIATNPDEFTRLLDMTVVVTLQSMIWIDDDRATEVFGDRGEPLVASIRRAREEIWEIAARAIPPDELEEFDRLIWRWKQDHSEVRFTTFVRFDQLASSRAKARVAEVRRGGGFLAPVDEARREVEAARALAERIFFLAKRAPMITQWQTEALVSEMLVKPEVQNVPVSVNELSTALQALASSLRQLPPDLEVQRGALITQVDQTVSERSEELIARVEKAVAASTDRLEHAASMSADRMERLIDRAFARAILFAVAVFGLAVVYRLWSCWVRRKVER